MDISLDFARIIHKKIMGNYQRMLNIFRKYGKRLMIIANKAVY